MSLFSHPKTNLTDMTFVQAKSSAISKQYVYPNRCASCQRFLLTKIVKLYDCMVDK